MENLWEIIKISGVVFSIGGFAVIKHLMNYIKVRKDAREDDHISVEEEKAIDKAGKKLYGSVISVFTSALKINHRKKTGKDLLKLK